MHNTRMRQSRGCALQALVAMLVALVYALLPAITHAQDPHIVREGDTLSAIADAYGLSLQDVIALNGLANPDLIVPGEVIVLDAAPAGGSVDNTVDGAADPSSALAQDDGTVADSSAGDTQLATSDALPGWVDRATIRADLVNAAAKWGWDPYLIMALAWQESGWRQDEVSNVGAIGVMQLMSETAAQLDDWLFQRGLDPWNNVWDNIDAGVAFLTCLYQESGDVEQAVGAYYQGMGSVQRDGFFPDTRAYVDNILYMRDLFAAGDLP